MDDIWGDDLGAFTQGAACRRGHVQTDHVAREGVPDRCATCGARIVTECTTCSQPVRGYRPVPLGYRMPWRPPMFCDGCGAPFPWAGRQERIFELENLLDEEELDEADRLDVQEALARLRSAGSEDGPDQDEQLRLWKRVKDRAPDFLAGSGKAIFESVTTAAIKTQLGL